MSITNSVANKILLLNVVIIILMIIADKFWKELGFSESDNLYYFLIGVIVFGISIGGAIVGMAEYRMKRKKAVIGLIGNFVLVLIFLIMFFYISHRYAVEL